MMIIDTPYYEDMTRISNSNIGWFLKNGPSYLRRKLDGVIPDEKTPSLDRGTMIHSYLLTPEEFQKDYVVWDKRRPSSAQQEKFCQELANSAEIEPNKAVLSAYRASYSTTNRSEEKMLSEGLKIASELKEYIDFLKSDDSRKMISLWDVKMLETIKQNFKEHKLAWNLLKPYGVVHKGEFTESGLEKTDEVVLERYHEFHINWEYTTKYGTVKCKSLLDSLTIDYTNKIITIMDLKTTAKLWHFEDSMESFDYARQLMYYRMAVEWYMLNEKGIDTEKEKWTFNFYIIGIDTVEDYAVRVFEITRVATFGRWKTIVNALGDIAWHQSNDKWDHSREYYEGDGSEKLNL